MDLKIVLWHRASGNLYFAVEPQWNSKLRYGIRLLATYDLKPSLNGTQIVKNLCVFALIRFRTNCANLKAELWHRATCPGTNPRRHPSSSKAAARTPRSGASADGPAHTHALRSRREGNTSCRRASPATPPSHQTLWLAATETYSRPCALSSTAGQAPSVRFRNLRPFRGVRQST